MQPPLENAVARIQHNGRYYEGPDITLAEFRTFDLAALTTWPPAT